MRTIRCCLTFLQMFLFCTGLFALDRKGPHWFEEGPIYETHPLYYDGTLKGVTAHIPEIAGLGVKTVYLMPIWDHAERQNPRQHYIYIINDYYRIAPEFGTEKDLKELVDTVHRNGMRIVFDLVTTAAAATGSVPAKNNWLLAMPVAELRERAKALGWELKSGTFEGADYIYSSDIHPEKAGSAGALLGHVAARVDGDRAIIHCFPWAHWGPAIDKTNPEVIDYFAKVAGYYVKEYGIDGWRVDAPQDNWNRALFPGNRSSMPMMRKIRQTVTAAKPDAILFAEGAFLSAPPGTDVLKLIASGQTPGDLEPVLDEFCEISYSYYFNRRLARVLRAGVSGDGTATRELLEAISSELVRYDRPRARFLEIHDTGRAAPVASDNLKALATLIVTVPGVPMIQVGQERGAANKFDWSSNTAVDFKSGDELRQFYKRLFQMRSGSRALKYGTIETAWVSGNALLAYRRKFEKQRVVVAINLTDKQGAGVLDVSPAAKGAVFQDLLSGEKIAVEQPGRLNVTVVAHGSRILVAM